MPYACPAKQKEAQRKWYLENQERHNKRSSQWRKENVEKRKLYRAKYNEKQRHVRRFQKAKQRARSFQTTPKWLTAEDNALILGIYEMARTAGPHYQVDHIIPLRGENVCGLTVPTNLQILHKDDNVRKGNRYMEPVCH